MNRFVLLALAFTLTACSTSKRVYEKPDFSLTGERAEKEIEKFTLSYANPSDGRFESEGFFSYFSMRDFRETMEEVSPESVEMMKDTKFKESLGLPVALVWVLTSFIKDSNGGTPFYWYGAGAFVGYLVYINHVRDEYVDQYNRDLKKKFSPSVGCSFSF